MRTIQTLDLDTITGGGGPRNVYQALADAVTIMAQAGVGTHSMRYDPRLDYEVLEHYVGKKTARNVLFKRLEELKAHWVKAGFDEWAKKEF
jgi:hypothetical protein